MKQMMESSVILFTVTSKYETNDFGRGKHFVQNRGSMGIYIEEIIF